MKPTRISAGQTPSIETGSRVLVGPGDDQASPYLCEQIITYIGNKRSLLPLITTGLDIVKSRIGRDTLTSLDVFSGSGIVSRLLKGCSRDLTACDIEQYAATINACYLSNQQEMDTQLIRAWVDRMNHHAEQAPRPGIIAELYAPGDDGAIRKNERVFYTQRNAQFIDTARTIIEDAPVAIKAHLLAPLLYVASVHANTSGVFKGFYKNSATGLGQFGGNGKDALHRICKPFTIPYPIYSQASGAYAVYHGDANELVRELPHVDVAYIDPPYNQHPYGSNYFMLNLITDYRRPSDISEVSGIPRSWNRSAYNRKADARTALQELVSTIDADFLLISFNSEGFIKKAEMMSMLEAIGPTEVLETSYNTFRGSRNLANRELHVTEYLYLLRKK